MFRISFGVKIGLAILFLSAVTTTLGVYYFYSQSQEIVLSQMQNRMRDLALTGTFLFRPEERREIKTLSRSVRAAALPAHEHIEDLAVGDSWESLDPQVSAELQASSSFQNIVQILRKIKAGSMPQAYPWRNFEQVSLEPALQSRIRFAYLTVPCPGYDDFSRIIFLADSDYEAIDENGNGQIDDDEEANPIGSVYHVDDRTMIAAFASRSISAGDFYTDRWGTWLTGSAPILDEDGGVLAVLSLDLDVTGEANRLHELRRSYQAIVVFCLALSIIVSFLLAMLFKKPISRLHAGAERLRQRDFDVYIDVKSKDELGTLAETFNQMVAELRDYAGNLEQKVRDRTAELNETLERVQTLKNQQDGDYYLTNLLADPLFKNWNKSQTVSTEFFIRQKKSFSFRDRPGELGGDLCVSGNLRFTGGRRHTMFLNADAMGKSMQGAGGALVMGTVINSLMRRSAANDKVLEITPQEWLLETFEELQDVFLTFDGLMAISCFLGVIDDESGVLYYFNAEHPLPVLYRNGQAVFFQEEMHLNKIGMLQLKSDIDIRHFQLEPADILICGSDGRDDIRLKNPHGEPVMNEDDTLFLRLVEQSRADLGKLVGLLERSGELTDDLSLIRVDFASGRVMPERSEQTYTMNQIFTLIRHKAYQEAMAKLETSSAQGTFLYNYYKGLCLARLGRHEDAIDSLERARAMRTDQAAVPELLAFAYSKLNRKEEARRYMEEAYRLDPHNSKVQKALARLQK
ncbi:MAG: SpoIIE family protein phosphatase [Spirochaetales bacterium]|nr:SpoIIE family protein phosphatase [Spirochaetales bacterium]